MSACFYYELLEEFFRAGGRIYLLRFKFEGFYLGYEYERRLTDPPLQNTQSPRCRTLLINNRMMDQSRGCYTNRACPTTHKGAQNRPWSLLGSNFEQGASLYEYHGHVISWSASIGFPHPALDKISLQLAGTCWVKHKIKRTVKTL